MSKFISPPQADSLLKIPREGEREVTDKAKEKIIEALNHYQKKKKNAESQCKRDQKRFSGDYAHQQRAVRVAKLGEYLAKKIRRIIS